MTSDTKVERLIEQRIKQAVDRDLPRLLVNRFYHNYVESWPQWEQTDPTNVPRGVKATRELGRTLESITTEVVFDDTTFAFKRFKVCEEALTSYEHEHWAYEVFVNDRIVLGLVANHHWAGGKPEFNGVTAYVQGEWEQTFKALKTACEELARKTAAEATAEKRKLKKQMRQQELTERLSRFGLDENTIEY